MADFFIVRKSTAEFTSQNETFLDNQRLICSDIRNGVETDTGYEKQGNSVTPWVSLPYVVGGAKVYRALLTQTAANDPVATVLENTLGGTVVWHRQDTAVYNGTLVGAFVLNKTALPAVNVTTLMDGSTFRLATFDRIDADRVRLQTAVVVLAPLSLTPTDELLIATYVEILVYP